MKNKYILGVLALISCALFSCTKENDLKKDISEEKQDATITRSITVSQDTKTTIDGDGNISWENGDVVYYYSYRYENSTLNRSGKGTATITEAGQSAILNLSVRAADQCLALLMPGEDGRNNNAVQSYDPTAFGYTGINPVQKGTFAFANIAVAHSNDAQNVTSLKFKNITSILKFNVRSDQNVKKVTLRPNSKTEGHQITGRITVNLTAESPSATYRSNYPNKTADDSFSALIDNDDEIMDGTYYFAVMPTTLSDGFTLTFNEGEAQSIDGMTYTKQKYIAGTTGSVTFEANHIKNVGNPIENKRITNFTIAQLVEEREWNNGKQYASFSVDDLITFSATGNNGYFFIYNETTPEWRCYQKRNNGRFTVACSEGRKITSITIKFNQSYNGALSYNGTTYNSPATITPVPGTDSMEFTVVQTAANDNGAQVKIKEVTVETK